MKFPNPIQMFPHGKCSRYFLSFQPLTEIVTKVSSVRAASSSTAVEHSENVLPLSKMPTIREFPILGSFPTILARGDFNNRKLNIFWKNVVKDYGPILKVRFPGVAPFVVVTKPKDIEKMYTVTMNNPVREAFQSLKKLRDEATDNFFEKKGGIMAENNEEWWRVRSKVQTPLMKPKNMIKFLPQMDQVAQLFMDRISAFQKEFGEMPPYFLEELYKWSLESLCLVTLNRRFGCLDPNLAKDSIQMKLIFSVNKLLVSMLDTELNVHWWLWFPTPAYKNLVAAHQEVLEIVLDCIKETEENLKSKSNGGNLTLLEILLRTEGLSRKDVITTILDLMIAGIDTTSHTVAFTLYLLSRNKEIQQRVQREIDSVLGDGQNPLTESHLAKLSYLKLCVKETLRLFPLAPGHSRRLETDVTLGGYHVPKGHNVLVLNFIVTRDESLFPRPDEFIPERWSRDKPLGEITPFGSLPFSHGTRMCIGRRIAEQEIYTFLARALHRFNVDYKYKDIEIDTKFVTTPSEPLKFEFTERNNE